MLRVLLKATLVFIFRPNLKTRTLLWRRTRLNKKSKCIGRQVRQYKEGAQRTWLNFCDFSHFVQYYWCDYMWSYQILIYKIIYCLRSLTWHKKWSLRQNCHRYIHIVCIYVLPPKHICYWFVLTRRIAEIHILHSFILIFKIENILVVHRPYILQIEDCQWFTL